MEKLILNKQNSIDIKCIHKYVHISAYMTITTIRISKEALMILRKFEIHPRESNEQLIIRLLQKVRGKQKCSNG